MILRKIRSEGMGYSRINSNRVPKLLHLSTKLARSARIRSSREDGDMEIEEEERNPHCKIQTGR